MIVRAAIFALALSAVAYGCWIAYAPLAYIVPGAIVLGLLIRSTRVGAGE